MFNIIGDILRVSDLTPEAEVLKELGARLARIRKQQGFSQTELAEEAGLGVATLRRIEAGQDSQMASWLKLLKTLGMVSAIEALLHEEVRSPMAEARAEAGRRKITNTAGGLVWGDERS